MFLTRQRVFFHGLVAIIEQRLSNPDSANKYVSGHCSSLRGDNTWLTGTYLQNDVIQWIIDTSPKSRPWTPGRMAFEVMAIWFGSVQGLATVGVT